MEIYSVFIYIAVAVLLINLIAITIMCIRKSFHVTLISGMIILGCIISVGLYLAAQIHGTELISSELAASLDIETQSYQTAGSGDSAAYAFYTKDGIECHIEAHELLSKNVPAAPQTVEIYTCTWRDGFPWCYLDIQSGIRYILK